MLHIHPERDVSDVCVVDLRVTHLETPAEQHSAISLILLLSLLLILLDLCIDALTDAGEDEHDYNQATDTEYPAILLEPLHELALPFVRLRTLITQVG